MTIADDVAAVTRRIAQIAGPSEAGDWNAALRSAVDGRPRGDVGRRESYQGLVTSSAARWRIEPALLDAVIANESGFDPRATSPAGARGLMQLMPATSTALGVRDAYDPAQNIAAGARYLRSMLDRFDGDVRLALAAYNAGPVAVAKAGGIPPYAETQRYVTAVLASRDAYRRR